MSSSFPGDIGEEAKTQSAVWQVDSQHDCALRKRKPFFSKHSLQPDHGRRVATSTGWRRPRNNWAQSISAATGQDAARLRPVRHIHPVPAVGTSLASTDSRGPSCLCRPRIDDPHQRRAAEAETRRTMHCAREVEANTKSNHFEPQKTTRLSSTNCDHRAAEVIVPFKTRAVGGSACIVLLCGIIAVVVSATVPKSCVRIRYSGSRPLRYPRTIL